VEEDINYTDDVKNALIRCFFELSKQQGGKSLSRTSPLTRSALAAVSRGKGQQAHGGPVVIPASEEGAGVL
jgi:hypothetical protein